MHSFSFSQRGAFRFAFSLPALIGLFVVGCSNDTTCPAGSSEAACTQRFESIEDATPMERSTPEELGIEPYEGDSVVASPIPALEITPHPLFSEDDSRIHNDHYNSAAYNRTGLVGPAIEVTTHKLGELTGICAMMTMLKNGYVVASCFRADTEISVMLTMFDNENLNIVAQRDLGFRPFQPNAAGGAYFTMDKEENIFIGPPSNRLEQYHIEVVDGAPEFVQDFSKEIPGLEPWDDVGEPGLQDTVIDFEGRFWFMVTDGRVGYLDPETDVVKMIDLEEGLQNSMVVDEGGVYMVTYQALYRLSVGENGDIKQDWRAPYDPGEGTGVILPGSGTSPTLFGTEEDLITICDNAASQVNAVVFDRATGDRKCEIPLFRPDESATENTAVGYGDELLFVNNGGFSGPFTEARTMNTGMERYRVLRDGSGAVTGCENVWKNDDSIANSAQLATASGVVWGYGADVDVEDADRFYLVAHSWETGDEIFRSYVGDQKPFDPITGQVHLHPDGTMYIGTFNGAVMMREVE
jgi:hypothetical protein